MQHINRRRFLIGSGGALLAWAVAMNGKVHLVGGYAQQRVDRPYHQVYDARTDRWSDEAPVRGRSSCHLRAARRRLNTASSAAPADRV